MIKEYKQMSRVKGFLRRMENGLSEQEMPPEMVQQQAPAPDDSFQQPGATTKNPMQVGNELRTAVENLQGECDRAKKVLKQAWGIASELSSGGASLDGGGYEAESVAEVMNSAAGTLNAAVSQVTALLASAHMSSRNQPMEPTE